MLQVYSTLTRKKEPFPKQPGETVSMYVCGPTVYKPSHIGHMVGPVIFDTVKRYLTYLGYKVNWVVNITDVDDKMIARAKEQNTTVPELAARMTADYYHCLKKLNVTGIDQFPKATEHIGGMIAMISELIAKDFAYAANGDVYFDVSKDHDYGKLCNRDPEQLEAGSRVEVSDRKRNPGDFALWKSAKPNEPVEVQYDSPWGKGRPGWHIECSCMAKALLGDTIDIHGGGLDLQFPHHENELAQSESANGVPFAKIWMHNGLLRMGKSKMAGSVGNVWNIADALKVVKGDVLRFFILNTHYRSPIDMGDWEGPASLLIPPNVEAVSKSVEGFYRFFERYERITSVDFFTLSAQSIPEFTAAPGNTEGLPRNPRQPETSGLEFLDHMQDDFNTGGAIGVLFETLNRLNRLGDSIESGTEKAIEIQRDVFDGLARNLRTMTFILGLFTEPPAKSSLGGGDHLVAGLMQLLLDLRANLRTEAKPIPKDNPLKKALFDQTDLIRTRLSALGITLEDRPAGTTWRVG